MIGGTPQEHGEKIAEHTTHQGAQKMVTQLIQAEIPAKDIAIVGRGLRSVESVTGRLGYAAAARSGAINGILLGLLFSAIFVLGTPNAALQLFIGVMLVGIAVGMLLSIVMYTLLRRRRDYTSITQVIADQYEVTVLPRSIQRARETIGRTAPPVTPGLPAPAVPPASEEPQYGERARPLAPPQYGERIDPAAQPAGERVDPAPEPGTGERVDPAPEPGTGERVDPEAPPRYGERVDPAPQPPLQLPGEGTDEPAR